MEFIKHLITDPIMIGILLALGICIWVAIFMMNREEENCKLRGGHIKDTTSVGIGIGGNGVSVVPSSLCLSPDGRILE